MEAWEQAGRDFITTWPIGTKVKIHGGFEDGLVGRLAGFRKHVSQDYPVYYVSMTYGSLIGGLSAVNLERLDGPIDTQPIITPLECYGCGAVGDYTVFGLPTRCPNCGSREIWSMTWTT